MAAVQHSILNSVPHFATIVMDTIYDPALRGVRCAAAGDLAIVDSDGVTRTIKAVLAGETLRGGIQKILTAGTTIASPTANIVGLL